MFVTFNMGNYEEDTIGQKLRYIDAISEDSMHYGTLERYTSHYDPNTSMYGRKITTHIKTIRKFVQDIEKEIREAKKRIEYYADAGKMGGQRESETREIVQSYYKMKLDAIKTQASLEREIDKSRKEDLKLLKDLYGTTNVPQQQALDDRSSDRAFMSSVLGGGVDNFFNSNTNYYSANQNVPMQPTPAPVKPTETPVAQPKESLPSNPLQAMPEVPTPEPVPQPEPQTPQPEAPSFDNVQTPTQVNQNQATMYIKNINGEDVPIYEEGPDDFIRGVKTYTDASLAYDNISLAQNPNVQKMFKFNEDKGMGWLVYYDMEEKHDIKDKGSLRNIEQIFPFEVDKQNGMVTTVLRESYPVLFTNEEPTEEVKAEYERLKAIEENKAQ